MVSKTLQSHAKKLLRDARKRARRKGVLMDISHADICDLHAKQEGVCALSAVVMLYGADSIGSPYAMSIDRIDPAEGYVLGNVQLVTRATNNAKSTMDTSTFVDMCTCVDATHGAGTAASKRKKNEVVNACR